MKNIYPFIWKMEELINKQIRMPATIHIWTNGDYDELTFQFKYEFEQVRMDTFIRQWLTLLEFLFDLQFTEYIYNTNPVFQLRYEKTGVTVDYIFIY